MNMQELFPLVNRKRGDDPQARPCFVIACSRCPRDEIMAAPTGRIPGQQVFNHFGHRHWQVMRNGKHLCPDCAGAARRVHIQTREAHRMAKATGRAEPSAETVFAPLAALKTQAPSPAACDAIVDLYMTLGDEYDLAKKCYRNGSTDASIAAKLKLSESVVRDRREKDFGPLVVDTVKEDCTKLLKRFEACRDEIRDVQHAIESPFVCNHQRFETALMHVSEAIADLRKLEAALAKKDGAL